MAVSYVWPVSLPQVVRRNFGADFGVNVARTPMDKGPAKQRYLGKRAQPMQVEFEMTTAQVATLETFFETTIKGTARFGFPHPRKGVQVEARVIPQEGGKLFGESYYAPGKWLITISLEVLP